jgi:cell fate (sporulation/competence/biofilm development) regulator YlbF (YheA/YmcA/DUF963 family)
MELTEEIKTAALQLGQSLHQDEHVRAYLDALQESQTDPDASAMEKKMHDEYKALITRQQSGEGCNRDANRAYYELNQQAQNNPLISRRNTMLRQVKPRLAQIAEEISFGLGVDYATLAKPQ